MSHRKNKPSYSVEELQQYADLGKRHTKQFSQADFDVLMGMDDEDVEFDEKEHLEEEIAVKGDFVFRGSLDPHAGGYNAFSTLLELAHGKDFDEMMKKLKANEVGALRVNEEDDHGMTPIFFAAKYGKVELFKVLLSHEARVYHEDKPGYIPREFTSDEFKNTYLATHDDRNLLMFAAESGSVEIVQHLLENYPADVFQRDTVDRSLLAFAASSGNLKLIEYLLATFPKFEEDIPKTDVLGRTLLMFAAQSGSMELCQFLIGRGLDPLAADETEKRSVLMYAAEGGNLELLKFIEDKGADVKQQTMLQKGVLSFAAQNKGTLDKTNIPMFEYLIKQKKCDPNEKDWRGRTVLMFACYGGNPLHVHYFIKNYELNPKIKDEEGRSVLMYATESGNRHTVEYLIEEKGCDPTAVEEHDAVGAKFTGRRTVLFYAMKHGHNETVEYLLKLGGKRKIELNERDDEHGTAPIHIAAQNKQWGLVNTLAEAGADVNQPGWSKKTVLMYACEDDNFELVKFLIQRLNADVSAEDQDGRTMVNHYLSLMKKSRALVEYEFLAAIGLSDWNGLSAADRRLMIRIVEKDVDKLLEAVRDSVLNSEFSVRRSLEQYELLSELSELSAAVGEELEEYAQLLQVVSFDIFKDTYANTLDNDFSPGYLMEAPGDDGRSMLELVLDSNNTLLASHPDLVEVMKSFWHNRPPPGTYVDTKAWPVQIQGQRFNLGDPTEPRWLRYMKPQSVVRMPKIKFFMEALSYIYLLIIVSAMAFDRIRYDDDIAAIEVLVFIQGLAIFANEALQMHGDGLDVYMSEGWNVFDIIIVLCIALLAIVRGQPTFIFSGFPVRGQSRKDELAAAVQIANAITTTTITATMTNGDVPVVEVDVDNGLSGLGASAIDESTLGFIIYASAMATLSVMVWLRLLYVLSLSTSMGPLLVSVQRMSTDVWRFLTLLFLFCAGFFFALVFITESTPDKANSGVNNEFAGTTALLLTLTHLAIQTDPTENFNTLSTARRMWVEVLLFIFLFMTGIVLVNLLIAMMATTYAKVQESAVLESFYQRLAIIKDYDDSANVMPPPFNLIVWVLTPFHWLFTEVIPLQKLIADCCGSHSADRFPSHERLDNPDEDDAHGAVELTAMESKQDDEWKDDDMAEANRRATVQLKRQMSEDPGLARILRKQDTLQHVTVGGQKKIVLDGKSADRPHEEEDNEHCAHCHRKFSDVRAFIDNYIEENIIANKKGGRKKGAIAYSTYRKQTALLIQQGMVCQCGRSRRGLDDMHFRMERISAWVFTAVYFPVWLVLTIYYRVTRPYQEAKIEAKEYVPSKPHPYRMQLDGHVRLASAIPAERVPSVRKNLTPEDEFTERQMQKLHHEIADGVSKEEEKLLRMEQQIDEMVNGIASLRADVLRAE